MSLADLERRLKALEADAIKRGQKISLKADNGQFVVAEEGGGREVLANRDSAGPWEQFEIVADPQ